MRRRIWIPCVLALCSGAFSVYRGLQTPVTYRAEARVLIEPRPPRVVDKVAEVVAEDTYSDPERYINGQFRVIESTQMSQQVERTLKMDKGSLAGRISLHLDRSSHSVTFYIVDRDPAAAVRIVNAYVDAYMKSTVADRVGVASDAARTLIDESATQRGRLETDEKALYEFQKHNDLPASTFEDSHKIFSTKLNALHLQEAQAMSQLFKLRSQLDELKATEGNPDLTRQLALEDGGKQWGSLHGHYMTLLEQSKQLEVRYGPQHPKVIESRESLDTVGKLLDKEATTAVDALRSRTRQTQREMDQLRVAIAAETQKALGVRQKELAYNTLHRKLDEDREAYSIVAKRLKEAELQTIIKQSNVRLLDYSVNAIPIGRQLPLNGMLGFLLGLGLGIALTLLLDYIDDTWTLPEEAEHDLTEPLLGLVMSIPAGKHHLDEPALEHARAEHLVNNPRGIIAEQCHSVATNLTSLFLEKPPRSLMVVSCSGQDGKTLLTVNLATAFAARGKRVLIIDSDLRRGRLHRLFGLARIGGFFELLTQRVTIDEAVRSTFIPGVDVITSGEVPKAVSPVRIFELRELTTVVEALKARYDLVLFDTAPVPLVTDALLLNNVVDGALGVVRAGKTSRRLVRDLSQQLKFAHVNLLGWVLNDVSEKELSKKYYYRYGYGRGYGYVQLENLEKEG